MKFFGLKTCGTCRKAIRELRDTGLKVDVIDVRADGISLAELKRFLAAFSDDMINRRSTTWRNLTDSERADDSLTLLSKHPTLMKRPIIEAHGTLYIGWNDDVRTVLLG